MSILPKCYGIIPVRYESTRFPGKALVDIMGKPMFWHVYIRAQQCPYLSKIILATDDDRILSAANQLDVPAVMTRNDHPSGTDRALEAAEFLEVSQDAVVVNIQGDEPALEPEMINQLVKPFSSSDVQVTTLARRISLKEAQNPDRVKVVYSKLGKALYFSRAPIPFYRDEQSLEYYLHIGLYAFRMNSLKQFVELPQGKLEKIERLEQLRLMENDIPVHVVITEHNSIGVDRPEDVQTVVRLMKDSIETK